MRTRRIAIGCRRAERGASVAVGPGEVTTHPELGQPGIDAAARPALPRDHAVPPDLAVPDLAVLASLTGAEPVPPAGAQAPARGRPAAEPRGDLGWNHNPGWPGELGWAQIARSAGGRPHRMPQPPLFRWSPRHRHPVPGLTRLAIPNRAFAWTGMGIGMAVLLTVLATLMAELVR
jgi:hypothetical protein